MGITATKNPRSLRKNNQYYLIVKFSIAPNTHMVLNWHKKHFDPGPRNAYLMCLWYSSLLCEYVLSLLVHPNFWRQMHPRTSVSRQWYWLFIGDGFHTTHIGGAINMIVYREFTFNTWRLYFCILSTFSIPCYERESLFYTIILCLSFLY